ncbi:MAG: hypothetical protein ACPGVG_18190, partial [Mycobacterium sp.]
LCARYNLVFSRVRYCQPAELGWCLLDMRVSMESSGGSAPAALPNRRDENSTGGMMDTRSTMRALRHRRGFGPATGPAPEGAKATGAAAYGFTQAKAHMAAHPDRRLRHCTTKWGGLPLYDAHNMPHLAGPRRERRSRNRLRGVGVTRGANARRRAGVILIDRVTMARRIRNRLAIDRVVSTSPTRIMAATLGRVL